MTPKNIIELSDIQILNSDIARAEQCLVDNGIDPTERDTVLQAIGYVLLGVELYEG